MTAEIIEARNERTDVTVPAPASAPTPQPQGIVTLFGSDDPTEVVARAKKAATALMSVVQAKGLSVSISGREYLRVEAWALLGSMVGVFPVSIWTAPIKQGLQTIGWEARVEARTINGAVVGAAESMCVRAETRWADADEHALRSMAQTRATSKALAMPLRFVAELGGYAGTPAEEMPATVAPSMQVAVAQVAQSMQPPVGAVPPARARRDLCAQCAQLGYKNRRGYPPQLWPKRNGPGFQCDGVDPKGVYMNHAA